MKFFDYVFYKMKWWNTKVVLDFSPFFSSIIIVSVFQGFNVLFVLNCIKYYLDYSIDLVDRYFLALPIIFIIFNFFYYRSPIKQTNIDKWVLEIPQKSKRTYNVCTILYFVLSLGLLIWIGYNIRRQNL